MKTTPTLVTLALLLGASGPADAQSTQEHKLSWLQGCWAVVSQDRAVEEQWMAPRGKTMLGSSRTVEGAKLVGYEYMMIREQGNKYAIEVRPSGKPPVVFTQSALTGLPTAAYLRTRLAEVYRAAAAHERPAADDHVLLVVSLDLSAVAGFPRLTGMILVADALREVFDSGQSVASLGPSVVAALVPKDERVASQGVALRRALHERLQVDAQLADVGRPRVSAVRLPATHELACDLLAHLARA